ncbi:MAG: hypothetical protein AB1500_07315 [Bacillota bacterium]
MFDLWQLNRSDFCLLTDNKYLAQAAKAKGLRIMATYVKDDRIFALQFTGPKKNVLAVTNQSYEDKQINLPFSDIEEEVLRRLFGNPVHPKPRKVCSRCGVIFEANSNRQQVCKNCRLFARREIVRKCVARCRQHARRG